MQQGNSSIMTSTSSYYRQQYELVQDSRAVLLAYCKTISQADFIEQNSSFGRGGSIKNLLVHIVNTYLFWVGNTTLKNTLEFIGYEANLNLSRIVPLFEEVDKVMHMFIELLEKSELDQISYELNGVRSTADPFKVFSHLITHEFHHKGQILSMSRHLGYIPVDTDIMR